MQASEFLPLLYYIVWFFFRTHLAPVRMNAYKNIFVYILLHTFLKWPVFPSLTKTLQIKLTCEIGFHIKYESVIIVFMCTTVTRYCLTLNGRTICLKSHSLDNNTIYVNKYNLLNWLFFYSFKIIITLFL